MGGAGRVPWSKVMAFADDAGMGVRDERARLWRMIGAMDTVYLEWLAERDTKDSKKS